MGLQSARAHWDEGRSEPALADAWKAYDAAPGGLAEKAFLARILRNRPDLITADRAAALEALLRDRDIDPGAISAAGWGLINKSRFLQGEFAAMAARLEADTLALALLTEDYVADLAAETALTRLRAWMLTTGRWRETPRLATALIAQATLNGGAWLFDAAERACFEANAEFAGAYLPQRASGARRADFRDPVTRAVAEQYEGWPYPQWRRISATQATTLAEHVRKLDPGGPDAIADRAQVLIAGCGTGRQVALHARRWPAERYTAIDLSEASLGYAAERCSDIGLRDIEFQALDLHNVATLGRTFDAIFCTGVLHHLPDPERGWAALAGVLKPGGVMKVMVYSKIARLTIRALRKSLEDLDSQTMSDDLLREARRRIISLPSERQLRSRDFFTLAGVHDLLMHRHEDPFDLPRIRRTMETLGLRLVQFAIRTNDVRARYRAENPQDPLQRDFDGWSRLERQNPREFAGMYDFWCRKQ